MDEGKRRAGAAVVDSKAVIWAGSLPEGTSAQKAELIALTKALELADGKTVNIYTDSRYAFATAHIHGAIYKQRGLLNSAGKEIKNKEEILGLLDAIHRPHKVAIIHCPGHQKGDSEIAEGNRRADREARAVASSPSVLIQQLSDTSLGLSSQKEEAAGLSPEKAFEFLKWLHQMTHLSTKRLLSLAQKSSHLQDPQLLSDLKIAAEQIVKKLQSLPISECPCTD